jgi:hypothetical protein
MVARYQVARHRQRCEQFTQEAIFLRVSEIHQIAGHEQGVRDRVERAQMRNGALQMRLRVHAPFDGLCARTQVHVADLGDNHMQSYPNTFVER